MQTATGKPFYRQRWWTPSVSVFLGLLMLGAFWLGGDPGLGFICLGLMVALGAVFVFGPWSETLAGLSGSGRDERWARIDIHATALAGMVVITVILGAFLVEVARGHDGSPYAQLAAVGGVAYLVAVFVLRARS